MLKNMSQLEFKIGEKLFHFHCDMDSPLDHAKEAVLQFLKYIQHIEDQVKANQAKADAEKAASSEVPPVVNAEEIKPAE